MGRIYKLFCINMNKIIIDLFKKIKGMRSNFEKLISDMNKKFENMQKMEAKLNELIIKNEE